jgi:hypothetical protein
LYINKKRDPTNFIIPSKTSINFKVGIGKRENTNTQTAENTINKIT